jgi:hypothetical protein
MPQITKKPIHVSLLVSLTEDLLSQPLALGYLGALVCGDEARARSVGAARVTHHAAYRRSKNSVGEEARAG